MSFRLPPKHFQKYPDKFIIISITLKLSRKNLRTHDKNGDFKKRKRKYLTQKLSPTPVPIS